MTTLRLKSNVTCGRRDPHPPKSYPVTTLRFFFKKRMESATAWLHIVQRVTIGHPGLGCSNLDALRGRQNLVNIHPRRRIVARIACRAVPIVLAAIAAFQQPLDERYASESASMKRRISSTLLLAAISSFFLGVSTP